MRKKILVLLSLALVLSANLHAQVTIGGLTTPKAGALLDLNSTTPGGLVLSNVDIDDLGKIPATGFVGISTVQDRNTELAGMIVYNTNTTTGIGIHVWDGEDWIKPCAPPLPGPITFSGTTNLCGAGSTFTAKIDSIKGATSYVWSLPSGLTGTSNDTIITITGAVGTYLDGSITVRAVSSCGGGTRRRSTQAVTVYARPAAPTNPSTATLIGGSSFTFRATPASGCTIDWYTAATGGSSVKSGNYFTETLSATTTYYAESRNTTTGCVSTSRLPVSGVVILSVSGCTSTPNVVITPANVAFASGSEHTNYNGGSTFSPNVKIVGLPYRTNFGTGTSGARIADYRDYNSTEETNLYGSFFSWCMVAQYADVLCSNGWRVPTKSDFDAYGGGSSSTISMEDIPPNHGWRKGGNCVGSAAPQNVGSTGFYWSSTPQDSNNSYGAHIVSNRLTREASAPIYQGLSLRCVK
jgi:uncharacterized protein (TIGR02145 family)